MKTKAEYRREFLDDASNDNNVLDIETAKKIGRHVGEDVYVIDEIVVDWYIAIDCGIDDDTGLRATSVHLAKPNGELDRNKWVNVLRGPATVGQFRRLFGVLLEGQRIEHIWNVA